MIYLFIKPYAALKFNHFLLRQIKLRGNYMEIHYASTLPRQPHQKRRQEVNL